MLAFSCSIVMALGMTIRSAGLKFGAFDASTSLSAANGKSYACIVKTQPTTREAAYLGDDDVRVRAAVRIDGDFVGLLVVRDMA